MTKSRSQPPTPTPVVLVVLPDEVARQIHRQLIQVNEDFETAAPRPRRAPARRSRVTSADAEAA